MRWQFIPFILFLTACGSNTPGHIENSDPEKEVTQKDELIGVWNMDSSAYINNGIRETVSAPLLPTTWTFDEYGGYKVQNSMTMSGSYSHKGDSLFVILMSVPNNYEILDATENHLHLLSTIYDTEEGSMKTEAYLTRAN